jgi:Tfp pilus assembly protein PilV
MAHHPSTGFAMPEVLIASAVLAFGTLAFASSMRVASSAQREVFMRQAGISLLADAAERLRAGPIDAAGWPLVGASAHSGLVQAVVQAEVPDDGISLHRWKMAVAWPPETVAAPPPFEIDVERWP